MPEIVETTIYGLEELSEPAKDRARAWYREGGFDYDWYDTVFDDFERICDLVGVELATQRVRLFGGGTRARSCIWFSGFASQGDGACFEGVYRYAKAALKNIRSFAPKDAELHRIAGALQAVQRRNFYRLSSVVVHRGRYHHEYSMAITVERDDPRMREMTADAEDEIGEALRDLARWLYRQLEREFDYLNSDEAVDAAILANGYGFTEAGERFG
ncbi:MULTISPECIES: hypothetical protein [unclassified Sphingopyxis]|jgi:hypothetical protein|uniref:hypothetical protein n=1 Tax=unclassified Sphingopyxis TaxID=2614943 RepID=UPI0007361BDC|nr:MULTISPECIES: hypothetical protein [unclassified Sphingopyxis]KTE18392.1 antitoxin of toxin-antitoxin stability system [Sphingopyxis sp. H050]MCA0208372.1 antitoxin of toxin-antitoxin stability system [Pseudomonadota bacterium]MDR7062433.1 hypothetical protein [Sphingopyxis sp. BE235]MDR7182867.1 hypothetical protein [Sphingopyxis sp. BE249]